MSMFVSQRAFESSASLLDRISFTSALVRTPGRVGRRVAALSIEHPNFALVKSDEDEVPAPRNNLFAPSETNARDSSAPFADSGHRSSKAPQAGVLIINADDWGRDQENTERIRECVVRGTISSVSAMVFMKDSERAAAVAQERGIDAGLHLNFTTPFSAPNCPASLVDRQREIAAYLQGHRFAQVVYHPGLARSFEYVFAAQMDEFKRLYQRAPNRLDGHHHMHLCANVLFGKLLPRGTIVRPNFSFLLREKSLINVCYRRALDKFLARRHPIVDFLFTLAPLKPEARLQRIFSLGRQFVVELETHPVEPEEYRFLTSGEIFQWAGNLPVASLFTIPSDRNAWR